ncbi:unnamed protein product [Fusarium venenatum]|uniref:Uncharacterized protein n=1 Tax=Fusarium venenatum TaxID=56646 RepID=A0A2L2SRT1_9HYPO|nr:uncharacterized protein FVRRES_12412 [Fusarium venenatum]CEI39721.1 unnamed protein product [Fusarium venenatum]
MCKQRKEKWVCKYCQKPIKEHTYLINKCKSQSDIGICREQRTTDYETIDMYYPGSKTPEIFNHSLQRISNNSTTQSFDMCQTVETRWMCAGCSKSILDRSSIKRPCNAYKKKGICTESTITLVEHKYVEDPDCEICKNFNKDKNEKEKSRI